MTRPWLVRGDLDGFFGLFVDNLLQLLLMATLCGPVCGFPPELIHGTILPGAAVSILAGNLFYAWQARRLMARTGRDDVTALPYGINTPSLVAYIFFIMGPVYQETKDPTLAWRAGLFACLLSGVMETAGAFVGDWLRRNTPRAALLSALAGVAITFIAMGFVFQIFAAHPALGLVPMAVILIAYASRVRLPFGLPGGLVAIGVGTAIAWGLRAANLLPAAVAVAATPIGFHPPAPTITDTLALLTGPDGWRFFAVILPMGLFNVIGSLQNLESAEAAGDRYETRPSLLANGLGSLSAAFFGSPFPTTIYIGHPGWKAMGARSGYSVLNGAAITVLCLAGAVPLVLRVVPIEAALGILLWIGIIMAAQAFQETPKAHALAVALGLVPALAAWGLFLVEAALRAAGKTLFETAARFGDGLYVHGMIALSQGFLLTSMLWAALLAHAIDREFRKAAVWAAAAAVFSQTGLIHAFELASAGVQNKFSFNAAPEFAAAYAVIAAGLWVLPVFDRKTD